MNLKIDAYGTVHVTLSRRNLTDLLAALESNPSDAVLVRQTPQAALYVQAEENAAHYAERKTIGPGINFNQINKG